MKIALTYFKLSFFMICLQFQFMLAQTASQKIIGLWKIENVNVGKKVMTPVAKWFRINENMTYDSGNGWLQNSEGVYSFDNDKNTFLPEEKNGIEEGFGAFTVTFDKNRMRWSRIEGGIKVEVLLKRIVKLPKATADYLVGLWKLEEILKKEISILKSFDLNNKPYFFISWDRTYRKRTPKGIRKTGYWHIHGHRPEVTFLSHDKEDNVETWNVNIKDNRLILSGKSITNKDFKRIYSRIYEFPE